MPVYTRSEARAWVREKMLGVANVVIPTRGRPKTVT